MHDIDQIVRKPPSQRTPEERARINKLMNDTLQLADDTARQAERLRSGSRQPEVLLGSIPEVLRLAALAIDYGRRAHRLDAAAKEVFKAAEKAAEEAVNAIRELMNAKSI